MAASTIQAIAGINISFFMFKVFVCLILQHKETSTIKECSSQMTRNDRFLFFYVFFADSAQRSIRYPKVGRNILQAVHA
jgi:hypothetical protein